MDFSPADSISIQKGMPFHTFTSTSDAKAVLGNPRTALASLVLVNVWKGMPFWMLMLSAGLKSIDRDLYEAAALDGASYVRRVWYVSLPGLRNVLVLTTLLAFIWTFNYFDTAYTMTRGGPGRATTTLPTNREVSIADAAVPGIEKSARVERDAAL